MLITFNLITFEEGTQEDSVNQMPHNSAAPSLSESRCYAVLPIHYVINYNRVGGRVKEKLQPTAVGKKVVNVLRCKLKCEL